MLRCALTLSVFVLISSSPIRAEPSVMNASPSAEEYGFGRVSPSALSSIARRYLGASGPQLGLPARLWCADFVNMVRRKAGLRVVPSRLAADQARFGTRLRHPEPGALMITGRRGGGHVDIISHVHADGTVSTIGGNVRRRVTERRRVARGLFIKPN